MPPSLDAFIGGRTAFYFGYPYETTEIRTRAPKLNFGIAKLPQVSPSKPKNIAVYPVEVVSKKTADPDIAWDFLQFTAAPERASQFLIASKRPTSLRALIGDQMQDPDIEPFAGQLLTAESWYKGSDYRKVEDAFRLMINTKPTVQQPDWYHIISPAIGTVNSTIGF
jgi:ABC-type glycerol-3-phosphate transport system substrate-binding protein